MNKDTSEVNVEDKLEENHEIGSLSPVHFSNDVLISNFEDDYEEYSEDSKKTVDLGSHHGHYFFQSKSYVFFSTMIDISIINHISVEIVSLHLLQKEFLLKQKKKNGLPKKGTN